LIRNVFLCDENKNNYKKGARPAIASPEAVPAETWPVRIAARQSQYTRAILPDAFPMDLELGFYPS